MSNSALLSDADFMDRDRGSDDTTDPPVQVSREARLAERSIVTLGDTRSQHTATYLR
jgi:hypothetical protein